MHTPDASLKEAGDDPGKFARTTGLNGMKYVTFAGGHMMMECAMKWCIDSKSRRRPDQTTANLYVERSRSRIVATAWPFVSRWNRYFLFLFMTRGGICFVRRTRNGFAHAFGIVVPLFVSIVAVRLCQLG